jgi:hypothetical protein
VHVLRCSPQEDWLDASEKMQEDWLYASEKVREGWRDVLEKAHLRQLTP